jgi:hypothetical protein
MCTRAYIASMLAAAGSVAHFVFIHHDVYYTWVTFAKGLRWVPSLYIGEPPALLARLHLVQRQKNTYARAAFSQQQRQENGENVLLFLFWRCTHVKKYGQAETALGLK